MDSDFSLESGKTRKKGRKKTGVFNTLKPPQLSTSLPLQVDESPQSSRSTALLSDPKSVPGDDFPPLPPPRKPILTATTSFISPSPSKPLGPMPPPPGEELCTLSTVLKGGVKEGFEVPNVNSSPVISLATPGSTNPNPKVGLAIDRCGLAAGLNQNGKNHVHPDAEQATKSYASLFQEASNLPKKGTLRFVDPTVTELGSKMADIPDDLFRKQAAEWSLTLVGYFIGKRPAFPFVKFHANRLWKRFDLDDVLMNTQGFFYLKFKSEQGMRYVFENGPWLFNDIPILLKRWQPSVWFDKPSTSEVSLWVNIYDMPVTLWDYEILSHIVSVIGNPIAVDRYTAEMCEKKSGRAVFARILVEVNAEQDIPKSVEAKILGTVKRFRCEYNWTPPRCSHCNIFGHKFIDCVFRSRTPGEIEPELDSADKPTLIGPSGNKEDEFQQTKKRRRRPKKAQFTEGTHIGNQKPTMQYLPKKTPVGVSNSFGGLGEINSEEASTSAIPSNENLDPNPDLEVAKPADIGNHLPEIGNFAEDMAYDCNVEPENVILENQDSESLPIPPGFNGMRFVRNENHASIADPPRDLTHLEQLKYFINTGNSLGLDMTEPEAELKKLLSDMAINVGAGAPE